MTRLQIAAQLRETAYDLLRSADELESEAMVFEPVATQAYYPSPLELRSEALCLYATRRKRDNHLPAELLGEPVWDMLLELFVAAVDGKELIATSMYSAGGTAPPTGRRYADVLSDLHLIESRCCTIDRRRVYYRLTREGVDAVSKALTCSIRERMAKWAPARRQVAATRRIERIPADS